MSCSSQNSPTPDLIERHPPERRQRKKEYIVLYSCCCCCCCCLHTLGGALGAVLGGNYTGVLEEKGQSPRALPSSQGLYWTSFLITLLLVTILLMIGSAIAGTGPRYGGRVSDAMLVGIEGIGLSVILIGPVWFLAACITMGVRIALQPNLRRLPGYWKQLGWLTLTITIGTIIGIVAMVIPLMLMGVAL